ALAAQAASWVVAEFLRLFHVADEVAVAQAITALMRGNMPLLEQFGEETVVTARMPCDTAVLLRVWASEPQGIDRRELTSSVKHPSPSITRAIQKLEELIHIHKTKS